MSGFDMAEMIRKKCRGEAYEEDEIKTIVGEIVRGNVQECQIGAFLTAIFLKNMNEEEIFHLTVAMADSGTTPMLYWNETWSYMLVDKHSTGGVGDKTSVPLVPALAACGLKVPMISGRCLGFTGGTLDKLLSIPGFTVELSHRDLEICLADCGCFIASCTKNIAPADGILYKIRDVTGTVDNEALMLSSIISKKRCENIKHLVIDLKIGSAAIFKTYEGGRAFGEKMKKLCDRLGINARIIFTRMDNVLGYAVGNSLEIQESLRCLRGNGRPDLVALVKTIGGHLLHMTGKAANLEEGEREIGATLENGKALKVFNQMLKCQGVSSDVAKALCDGDENVLPKSPYVTVIKSETEGWITGTKAFELGKVAAALGASRKRVGDDIDASVGIKLLNFPGTYVKASAPLAEIHHSEKDLGELPDAVRRAFSVENADQLAGNIFEGSFL